MSGTVTITVVNMAVVMQAQIESLQQLEVAFDEIGPVNQFNASVLV
jgi:hypothetical protein